MYAYRGNIKEIGRGNTVFMSFFFFLKKRMVVIKKLLKVIKRAVFSTHKLKRTGGKS